MNDINPTHAHLHPSSISPSLRPYPTNVPLLKPLEHHSTNVPKSDFQVLSLISDPLNHCPQKQFAGFVPHVQYHCPQMLFAVITPNPSLKPLNFIIISQHQVCVESSRTF